MPDVEKLVKIVNGNKIELKYLSEGKMDKLCPKVKHDGFLLKTLKREFIEISHFKEIEKRLGDKAKIILIVDNVS